MPNERVSGYVEQNSWNFYRYIADNSQSNIVISVLQIGTQQDCDLYVRLDDTPTRWNYDYLEISPSQTYQLVIPDVISRTLYIGIFGWLTSEYELNVTQTLSCPFVCVNGNCVEGICQCHTGWAGPDCNSQHTIITSGQLVRGYINSTNSWQYYHFVSSTTTVVISLIEEDVQTSEFGELFLFAVEDAEPTLRRYDYMDNNLNRDFHTITIILDHRVGETINWMIGVYGTAFVVNPVPFKLVVWEPI